MNWTKLKKKIWEWWYGTTKSDIRLRVYHADDIWLADISMQDRTRLGGPALHQYDLAVAELHRRNKNIFGFPR